MLLRWLVSILIIIVAVLTSVSLLCPFPVVGVVVPETVSLEHLIQSGSPFNLDNLQKLAKGQIVGPESIICNNDKYFAGTADGKVVAFHKNTNEVSEINNIGGRPLGLHLLSNGELIVAEAVKGDNFESYYVMFEN